MDSAGKIGSGQAAKAFTLYVRDSDDAVLLQRKIDEVLDKNGLATKRAETGYSDSVAGATNRVGITRDIFPRSVDSSSERPLGCGRWSCAKEN